MGGLSANRLFFKVESVIFAAASSGSLFIASGRFKPFAFKMMPAK